MRDFGSSSTTTDGAVPTRSWRQIRERMEAQYLRTYTPNELRAMEIKWRRIFAEAGWSVKGV